MCRYALADYLYPQPVLAQKFWRRGGFSHSICCTGVLLCYGVLCFLETEKCNFQAGAEARGAEKPLPVAATEWLSQPVPVFPFEDISK